MSESTSMKNIVVKKETVHRLLHDIKQLFRNPLTESGIYYEHDESNIFRGYALICGQPDTPYFGGFYLFQFDYPYDYPSSPPKVTFCTCDGMTRFNPNLYVEGKVCVSILNTWSGEEWSSCQTVTSVLLVLCTLLNNEPLLNEPGFERTSNFFIPYNKILEYQNINFAICELLMSPNKMNSVFHIFLPTMEKLFFKNYDKLMEFVEDKITKEEPNGIIINIPNIYNMRLINAKYIYMKNKLITCREHLEKNK